MMDFKQGWLITKRELSVNRVMFIWCTVMMIYMGVLVGFLYYLKDDQFLNYGLLDLLMLVTAPLLSIDYSRRSFRLMKDDTYRQQMIYFRSLPVPFAAVLGSRLQMMGIMLLYNSMLFFGLIYMFGAHTIPGMTAGAYISFAITWIGLGLVISAIYVYLELTSSAKWYLFWSIISVMLMIGVAIAGMIFKWHLSELVMTLALTEQLVSPLMWSALALAIVTLWLVFRSIDRKAKVRDLV
ncbi:hypothetical protein [Paenibacillus campi]|uniref:hypothetical protein n=1 Tax=Paenibacillus campi TaxID=3106031 RepID=UPI002AFF2669|nr:hypothetical protein [Paenibacillus sp. SGZ-1014]